MCSSSLKNICNTGTSGKLHPEVLPVRKETMAVKGIIFDLDGVIVFTDHYHYLAWKMIADEMGIYFDETINNRLRGVSRMESLEIILENYHGDPLSDEEKTALAEKKNDFYRKLLREMSPDSLDPEVKTTLQLLRERGFKLAVGSSSKNARTILAHVQLTEAFDAISDGTNITHSKPDPEVFQKAAQFLGLDAENCAVIEDAFAGIDAACTAGMVSVGIGDASGYGKSTYHIQKFSELLNIFT